MATWIAHMRIAEHFMNFDEKLNSNEFLVGNLAPDCGVPNEDWSKFTPDSNVTHWKLDGKNINIKDFKDKYIHNSNPFYLGYFFHLITDIEWDKLFTRKKSEPLYYEGLNTDPQFIWIIKKDWYGQDHLYLERNPDSIFFRNFQHINEFNNIYFEIYPEDAFTKRIRYITDFYLNTKEDAGREFPYLSKNEMDSFVDETIVLLKDIYYTINLSENNDSI